MATARWEPGMTTALLYNRLQSRARARDPSVEGNEDSRIIQTGSQKSWLISTAHVSQTFDTFRNKLANINAIGSTKNGLSTVEQREGSDLSKGTFRSSKFSFQR